MITFYSYRYLLARTIQTNLDTVSKTNNEFFTDFFSQIEDMGKVVYKISRKKYFFYFIDKIDSNIYLLQFAKEQEIQIPHEGKNSVDLMTDIITPYVNMIVDLKRQIILIENKLVVYSDNETPRARISKLLEQFLHPYDIIINVKEISSSKQFWENINQADQIYNITLDLPPPNLFNGRFEADKLVKEVYGSTHFSDFKIILKSATGGLKILKDAFGSYINLIASGGGSYTVKLLLDGIRDKIGNFKYVRKLIYDVKDLKEIDKDKLKRDLDNLDDYKDE